MAIQIGDKAPEVLGLDQNGKEIKLSDFKGKKLAALFLPERQYQRLYSRSMQPAGWLQGIASCRLRSSGCQ